MPSHVCGASLAHFAANQSDPLNVVDSKRPCQKRHSEKDAPMRRRSGGSGRPLQSVRRARQKMVVKIARCVRIGLGRASVYRTGHPLRRVS